MPHVTKACITIVLLVAKAYLKNIFDRLWFIESLLSCEIAFSSPESDFSHHIVTSKLPLPQNNLISTLGVSFDKLHLTPHTNYMTPPVLFH